MTSDTWSGAGFTYATGGNFTAVPEPTSGLLLLLGMAGLALKRKRA
ncbi:MAG: PEP-CTERM sorting domain-containing protein [Kiritimatiellae bacterium]|nr:PEP-CTERM sorting domain-containing protein [Kiritimatiellia bacterium]